MILSSYVLEVKMDYEGECAFVPPEVCEQIMDANGMNMADEEARFYEDFR